MPPSRILVVDRSVENLERLEGILHGLGYLVTGVTRPGSEVPSIARAVRPDLALVPLDLSGETGGADVARKLRGSLDIPVIFVLEGWTEESWLGARGAQPAGYVLEPVRPWDLRATIDLALLRHGTEIRLRREEEQYRLLFERNVAGVYRKTVGGTLLRCNVSFSRIFGYSSPRDLENQPAANLYAAPEDREAFRAQLHRRGSVSSYEIPMKRRDGTTFWVLANAALSHDPETDQAVVVGTLVDITERKALEARLERLAYRDPLTGLANRRSLDVRAKQAISMAARRGDTLAVLFLDLVQFKQVNDSLGHHVGDHVLAEVGRRLEEGLRSSDTAARLGGDEFVVLLGEVDGVEGARRAGQRVLESLSLPVVVEGTAVNLSARVAVTLYPDHGESMSELMTLAGRLVAALKPRRESVVEVYGHPPEEPRRSSSETADPSARRAEGSEAATSGPDLPPPARPPGES